MHAPAMKLRAWITFGTFRDLTGMRIRSIDRSLFESWIRNFRTMFFHSVHVINFFILTNTPLCIFLG
ncbi:hypothetical protein BW33_02258 [Pseudomonas sp. RIT288]|nr:hypothetical protein BW33_02258 [Pseudomonas sp. RIT288]